MEHEGSWPWSQHPDSCFCPEPDQSNPRPNPTYWISFLYNKTNRRTNFPNLFCQETLHVSDTSSAHHQEFSTVHSALVYVMQVWWQFSSTTRTVVLENCHQTCMTYTSAECTVENSWWWAEEVSETCRVYWQNKFGKLVRLLVLL